MKKEKRKKAVALKYDSESGSAPRIAAKGSGLTAEKIIELAKKHDIPIHEDRDLVEVLAGFDLGKEIPPELYRAVAEILAFIYRVNNAHGT